jgi:hypothetical protein
MYDVPRMHCQSATEQPGVLRHVVVEASGVPPLA